MALSNLKQDLFPSKLGQLDLWERQAGTWNQCLVPEITMLYAN